MSEHLHGKTALFVSFGEAMMRYAPAPELKKYSPHSGVEPYWKSIGGDELNVSVALAKLGYQHSYWISAIGDGPDDKYLLKEAKQEHVNVHAVQLQNERLGTFTTAPEEKKVYYNRKDSAFARHEPKLLDWPKLLQPKEYKDGGVRWLHMTGITPMLGPNALKSWRNGIDTAAKLKIPVSLDFNHRPQLGSFESLWSKVQPYNDKFWVIVLAIGDILNILKHEGLARGELEIRAGTPHTSPLWHKALIAIRAKLKVKWLVCCFKTRDDKNLQTRWSSVASEAGITSTIQIPTLHTPKEETGGGSAFFAGFVDYVIQSLSEGKKEVDLLKALRRADLLAALCQETLGDWSSVERHVLYSFEKRYDDKPAKVDLLGAGGVVPSKL